MKRAIMFAMVAAVAVAFTGCKKPAPTPAEQVSGALKQADKATQAAAKDADKAAADAQKKVDEAVKK